MAGPDSFRISNRPNVSYSNTRSLRHRRARSQKSYRIISRSTVCLLLESDTLLPMTAPTALTKSLALGESQPVRGSIFDLPAAYQGLFGRETEAEARLFAQCLRTHLLGSARRIFEPGCGGGRILRWFRDNNWAVCGLDESTNAVGFANRLLADSGDLIGEESEATAGPVYVGDMTNFNLSHLGTADEFDAAYCSVNTIRHLPTDVAIRQHLAAMATIVRPGGVYAIEIELTETAAWSPDTESFSSDDSCAHAVIWRKRAGDRQEILGTLVSFDDGQATTVIEGEVNYRTYSHAEATSLLDSTEHWTLITDFNSNDAQSIHDRWIFVLRRI